jgi:allantoate deiminase
MSQSRIVWDGEILAARLDELAGISDDPGPITRTFLSPAMQRANLRVAEWMQAAGLTVREDTVGNLIGRREADLPAKRGRAARTLLLGSHLDTVRNAGRFDGPLGVLLPIAAMTKVQERGLKLPFAVEVLGFSEEEGVRFSSAYLGSKGYGGKLTDKDLALRDADDVGLRAVLEHFNAGKFELPKAAHKKSELLGYVEVHIEQGPVLEKKDLAVGVVTAIAGQTRARLTFTGKAGHAGTTPMALRQDAYAGAAEFALAAEQLARSQPGLVATVGSVVVKPGAPNVIPGEAIFSLDLRHADDEVRQAALKKLTLVAEKIAHRRKLTLTWQTTQENGAVACSSELTAELERSVKAIQGRSLSLVSGAGHDGVVMSELAPIAMLFVRCRGGLSHHPDEYASPADIGQALRVMEDFLERLADKFS